MTIDLLVMKGVGGEWIFRATFENCSDTSLTLPLDVVKRNGARIGLHFSLLGKEIEPVDMLVISPRNVADEVIVSPGNKISVDFVGKAERKSAEVYALIFEGVTYKIEPNSAYKVQFIWHDMKSNVVAWKV